MSFKRGYRLGFTLRGQRYSFNVFGYNREDDVGPYKYMQFYVPGTLVDVVISDSDEIIVDNLSAVRVCIDENDWLYVRAMDGESVFKTWDRFFAYSDQDQIWDGK